MSNLEKIQKGMRVLQILSKIIPPVRLKYEKYGFIRETASTNA